MSKRTQTLVYIISFVWASVFTMWLSYTFSMRNADRGQENGQNQQGIGLVDTFPIIDAVPFPIM